MKIKITDTSKNQFQSEFFPNLDLEVVSRSGLHPTETNLLKQNFKEKDALNSLFINNRTGVLPIYLKRIFSQANISILNTDYHYYKRVAYNINTNASQVNNLCLSSLSKQDSLLTQLFIQIDSSTYSKEFYLDMFVKHYNMLKMKGKIFISCDKREKWFEDFLVFNNLSYSLETFSKSQYVLILRKSLNLKKLPDYSDVSDLHLPQKPLLSFYSVPGVFAHHRIDEGAIALIETVQADKSDTVIDMGCGVGTVGISLAKYWQVKETILVDSNARAIDCAKHNIEINNVQNCRTILTDNGVSSKKATIFVGNPPYFSNYRIADLFIDNSYSNLVKGGKAYIVAKNIKHIEKAMRKVYNNINIIKRRGYNIVISTKD